MSIQPPSLLCQPWTGLISSGSSPPLSFPGLLHISFKQVLLEDSNLAGVKQHRPWGPYSIAVELRLMKVLDSASFYTLSSNIPVIFLIHLRHSCYIRSTFYRYSSCILFEFLDARTVFGSHSANILSAFVYSI